MCSPIQFMIMSAQYILQPAQALRGVLSPQQLQERSIDRQACSRSIKHALDLASRRISGGAIRNFLTHAA
jgi:hypothetical protein